MDRVHEPLETDSAIHLVAPNAIELHAVLWHPAANCSPGKGGPFNGSWLTGSSFTS